MKITRRRIVIVSLILGSMFLYFKGPSDESVTQSLENIIPKMRDAGIAVYRNQDWCKVLVYNGEAFSNTDQSNCIYVTTLPTKPFTPDASAKLSEISGILSLAKVKIVSVEKIHAGDGILYAEFHVDCSFCRTRYVFDPGYRDLPMDLTNELYHHRINENWYRVEEDWN